MIVKGDHVYFQSSKGPRSGEVKAVGKHGTTVFCDGKHHKVKHGHVLGMKQKIERTFTVIDQGDDGALVQDSEGTPLYLRDTDGHLKQALARQPDKGTEPENMRKSFDYENKVILFLKAGSLKNRPGLSLQEVTDNQGHITHKWKRTGEVAKKGHKQKAEGAEKDGHENEHHQLFNSGTLSSGDHVSFNMGEKSITGEIVSSGKDGVMTRDETGKTHSVFYHEIHARVAERPNYAKKNEDEKDKPYLKRIKNTLDNPKHLPEEHARYFNMEGSTTVPVDKLVSTKSDAENQQGGNNSPKFMLAAYHGQVAKRDPISVEETGDGQYRILDGNGTYSGVKKYGWKSLPVKVVKTKARQQSWDTHALFTPQEMNLSTAVTQKNTPSIETLYRQAGDALVQFKTWLGEVASKKHFKVFDDDMHSAMSKMEKHEKGVFVIIAGLKGQARATEKMKGESQGWSGLKDIVRGTIAVDNLHELSEVLGALRESGMKIARRPKNRFAKPVAGGYRDLMFNVEMKNGHICELQINTKAMILAKEEGHKHYEVMRPITEKAEREGRSLTPEEAGIIERETKRSQVLYSQAWNENKSKTNVTNEMKKAMIVFVRRSI